MTGLMGTSGAAGASSALNATDTIAGGGVPAPVVYAGGYTTNEDAGPRSPLSQNMPTIASSPVDAPRYNDARISEPAKPSGPKLLSADPPSTHEVINQAKAAVAPVPLPRSRPADAPTIAGASSPRPSAPVPLPRSRPTEAPTIASATARASQPLASDGLPIPRPPADIPMKTPFGTNIKVQASPMLPKGLAPDAAKAFAPIVQSLTDRGVPVQITSGYRSPSYNARVGGAGGSQHMGGKAIDIALSGLNDVQKRTLISTVHSDPNVRGFGYYPKSDSIHIDVRPGERVAWGSNYSSSSVGKGWPTWLTKMTQAWLDE
jgi:hypothetical protein